MEHLLPFNSTSILYRVFSTLCPDERQFLFKPHNKVPIPEKSDKIVLKVFALWGPHFDVLLLARRLVQKTVGSYKPKIIHKILKISLFKIPVHNVPVCTFYSCILMHFLKGIIIRGSSIKRYFLWWNDGLLRGLRWIWKSVLSRWGALCMFEFD